ncbi:MAG: heat-inducible transcriptional repressor HrcA [Clostridiales bacterium]|nr:heat-inducible transcriptional repressor HrcA [Clostridiales bacterium]
MSLNERKLRILQAIISDFIYSAEPVGSRTLSKKYDMGISPATIRNEMSDLEEMGFLTHPHTSAGRVPSDKAYRLYVDNLMKKYEISEDEKKLIDEKLTSNVIEFEKTIQHAASLLSELTNLTAFAMTPKPEKDTIKHIKLMPVDEITVILMIVSESGKVSNTALKLAVPYTEEGLDIIGKAMTYSYKGKSITDALKLDIIKSFEHDIEAMSKLAQTIVPNFLKTLQNMLDVNLYMDGLTNIFSFPEYNDIDKAKVFLKMLDKKDHFRDILINRENGVIITIGDENSDEIIKDCSLITATYHVDGTIAGKIGVIGPKRMKYDEVTSIIEYVTENLSNTFKLSGGSENNE